MIEPLWRLNHLVVKVWPPDGVDEADFGQGQLDGVRSAEGDQVLGRATRQENLVPVQQVVAADLGRREPLGAQELWILDQIVGYSGLKWTFVQGVE